MLGEMVLSLDFLAAVITFFYVLKLLFQRTDFSALNPLWQTSVEKKSLLNQQVASRHFVTR